MWKPPVPVVYASIALCAGLAGGAGSDWLRQSLWPPATAAGSVAKVVTATEFDLIDSSGAVRGKLYMKYANTPAFVLYDLQGREAVSLSSGIGGPSSELELVSGNNEIAIRANSLGTYLWFDDQGPSGQSRFTIQIGRDQTLMSLSGADHKTSVDTAISRNGSAISLTDHNDKLRATFGMNSKGNSYIGFDDDNRVRAELNGTSLSLFDEKGTLRAAVGSINLKNTKTGSTEHLSPSSVTLFGENGHFLWGVP